VRWSREQTAEWRNAAAYASLQQADRSLFAWEWLRRDPRYRDAAAFAQKVKPQRGTGRSPGVWGLHAFENPEVGVPEARPLWRGDVHPLVLKGVAQPATASADTVEFGKLAEFASLQHGLGGEQHLLLSDGLRTIRLDLAGAGVLLAGPVELHYRLFGLRSAAGAVLALRRLLALCESGRFSRSLHPREARAARWILELRVHDALASGAGQREIAAVLLSQTAAESRWRINVPSVRLQVQRLVRSARSRLGNGYRAFLL